MSAPEERNYFIAKQDLLAFEAWPGHIWKFQENPPPLFQTIKKYDRWLSFAYISEEDIDHPQRRLVTGFYECITPAYLDSKIYVPNYQPSRGKGWVIVGKKIFGFPQQPVNIPPIDTVLNRRTKRQGTLIQISADEFEKLKKAVEDRELNPETIPVLGREPECEQELVAVVARDYQRLGIEKIIRVRTRFPDMLVKLKGHVEEVHLELEFNSKGFLDHESQIKQGKCKEDNKPVAVLCWIDDEPKVHSLVHKVYELQTLLRDGKKITW